MSVKKAQNESTPYDDKITSVIKSIKEFQTTKSFKEMKASFTFKADFSAEGKHRAGENISVSWKITLSFEFNYNHTTNTVSLKKE